MNRRSCRGREDLHSCAGTQLAVDIALRNALTSATGQREDPPGAVLFRTLQARSRGDRDRWEMERGGRSTRETTHNSQSSGSLPTHGKMRVFRMGAPLDSDVVPCAPPVLPRRSWSQLHSVTVRGGPEVIQGTAVAHGSTV